MPSWMQLNSASAPAATTMQFESEPAGAEARTSLGQTCRTPCSLAVTASEFTVSFTLAGYQPQTVPVQGCSATPTRPVPPRLVPNPVFVELQPGAPAPAARRQPPPRQQQKPKPAPRQPPTAMAPRAAARSGARARFALAAGALSDQRVFEPSRPPRRGRSWLSLTSLAGGP